MRRPQANLSDVRQSQASTRRERNRAAERAHLKDVKNQGRSGNVYENKGSNDNVPEKKDDISYLCAPFYTQIHVFPGNRRLFCHY